MPLWSALGNAGAALTLANAGYATTFNQTSAVAWSWNNATAAVATGGGFNPLLVASTTTNGTSGAINTTGATLFVVVMGSYGGAVTMSDSQSNSWHYLTSYALGSNNTTQIAYCYGPTTNAAHTFTINGGHFGSCVVYAFSGTLATSAVFDSQNGINSTGVQAGSITPTAGDIVVAGNSNNGTLAGSTINQGFSVPLVYSGGENSAGSYLLNAANSPVNPTWSNNGVAVIACFKAASVATSNASPIITLAGTYWNGSASAVDSWQVNNVLGIGTNPTSTLTFAHAGSSSFSAVSIPTLLCNNFNLPSTGVVEWNGGQSPINPAGISYLGAASLAIGNGASGDYSGSLKLTSLNVASTFTAAAGQIVVPAGVAGSGNIALSGSVGYGFGIDGSGHFFATAPGALYLTSAPLYTAIGSGSVLGIASTAAAGVPDSAISRLGAASLAIGNGTAGDKTGTLTLANLILSATQSPASNAAGTAGQLAYDGSYIYICIASGNWRRVATTGGY